MALAEWLMPKLASSMVGAVDEIVAKNLEFELAFAGPDQIAVTRAQLRAFGGTLSAEPFKFFPKNNELDATLIAEAIVVEQVLALAKDVPAKATGLVDGRLPIRIDGGVLAFTMLVSLTAGLRGDFG